MNSVWVFLQDVSGAFSRVLASSAGVNGSVLTVLEKDLCLNNCWQSCLLRAWVFMCSIHEGCRSEALNVLVFTLKLA